MEEPFRKQPQFYEYYGKLYGEDSDDFDCEFINILADYKLNIREDS